jgi:hypothetical protein
MEIATLSAGLGAVRTAYQGLKTVLETKSQITADQRVLDALTKLGSALDATYDLRDELFRLQDENRALKDTQREPGSFARPKPRTQTLPWTMGLSTKLERPKFQ